ncbi:zinc finger MYM-type protein 1-like [Ruditapes philippinarum]|uniref:zinc finger MYM-type protein 1-like n=1 Tax=Ruditapes philippinarum TaxID=129788 RepID=UPI00295BE94F|nr:zinc finger MYM-type protein 1-like [Ruditapes philippinarum]
MASDKCCDPPYGDVFLKQSLDANEKTQLLNAKWESVHHYGIPSKYVGGKFRKIQFRWFVDNTWLHYSTSKQGVYCAPCFLFSGKDENSKQKSLAAVPLVDPSNIGKTIQAHAVSNLHRESCEAAHNFISVMTGDKKDIVCSLSSAHEQTVEKNRKILVDIVDSLILCGRQNIAIRRHQDDRSNFAAIHQLQAKDNTVLRDHLEHDNPRTKYTSPEIQNELISICGEIISKTIVEACNAAPFFGFIADEATDAATMEQMAIVLRYYDCAPSRVCEDFLCYANCSATTGEALANAFLQNLETAGVNLQKMRGQGYDGAANMAGQYRGVQACIRQIFPKALYTHCKAHSLNLAIVHASKEPLARNMMGTVQEIAFLFDYSAKRLFQFQASLAENDHERVEMEKRKKLQTLCETRWAARADALYTFKTAYGTVVKSLERLSENNDTKAGAYRAAITQFSFIITLVAIEHVLSGSVQLSKLLQSTTCDLVQAATEAEVVKTQVEK